MTRSKVNVDLDRACFERAAEEEGVDGGPLSAWREVELSGVTAIRWNRCGTFAASDPAFGLIRTTVDGKEQGISATINKKRGKRVVVREGRGGDERGGTCRL